MEWVLNQSLWLDEAIVANVVKNLSVVEMISKYSPTDFHPPLYYVLMKLWTAIFGFSEISLRAPSIVVALIAAYFVYKIARNRWAMALFLTNPLIVYYAGEARMYMMATCLLIGSYYFLTTRKIGRFNLLVFLACLTFYGSLLFVLTILIYLLIKRKLGWQHLVGVGAAMIILAPLIRLQLLHAQEARLLIPNWGSVLGKVNLKNLLLIPIKFTSGRISFYPKIAYYLISGLWAGWILAVFRKRPIYLYFFGMPLILGIIISVWAPMLAYFRFIYLVPILCLALAESRWRGVVLAGFVVFSSVYVFNQQFWREDWKTALRDLDAKKIVMIESLADPVKYYRPDKEVVDIRNPAEFEQNLTVIPYGEAIHGIDHQGLLTEQGYVLTEQKNYREIVVERWTKSEESQNQ